MTQTTSSRRFEFLDGLRGIAALAVILFHFNGTLKDHGIFVIPAPIDFLYELGHYGVQIFFVLSGFVIAYSLRNEKISAFFCLQFFVKRSIRLDPPYWLIIALMVGLSFLGNLIFDKKEESLVTSSEVLMNLIYLPDFFRISRILPVAWTLCIEIQFYMCFVLLLLIYQFLMQKIYQNREVSLHRSFVFHFLFGFFMIFSILQNTSWALLPSIPGLFIPYWYSFFIGCMACWTILNMIHPSVFWIYCAGIASFCLVQESMDALAVLAIVLMIYFVAAMNGLHHALTSWFFQYSGKISYSLYLIHWPIGMKFIDINLRFFGHKIDSFWTASLLMMLSFAVTFLAAHVFYYLIESPSLRMSQTIKMKFVRQPIIGET